LRDEEWLATRLYLIGLMTKFSPHIPGCCEFQWARIMARTPGIR
jgi:hypothetical protein